MKKPKSKSKRKRFAAWMVRKILLPGHHLRSDPGKRTGGQSTKGIPADTDTVVTYFGEKELDCHP